MRRILVIDDDRILQRDVCKALSEGDYEVSVAMDAVEGIRRAQTGQPDLILLDVVMPGMDGIGVLQQLRADPSTSTIPVIMVTSLGSEDQIAACLEEGALDHITKPFSHRFLRARIDAARSKRRSDVHDTSSGSGNSSQVIAFLGAKGGVGTTTLAANAATVAAHSTDSTLLCELRPSPGTLAQQLNAQPRENLGGLLQLISTTSTVAWDCFLVRDSGGLRILFGPQPFDGPAGLNKSRVPSLIDALRAQAGTVFLDLEAGLTELNCEILKHCDQVVLTTDCEPTSLAAASAIIETLQQTSIRHSIKAVAVKRTGLAVQPKVEELHSALNCNLIGVIPPGADALTHAARTGASIVTLQPDDAVALSIRRLTEEHLLSRHPVAANARPANDEKLISRQPVSMTVG